ELFDPTLRERRFAASGCSREDDTCPGRSSRRNPSQVLSSLQPHSPANQIRYLPHSCGGDTGQFLPVRLVVRKYRERYNTPKSFYERLLGDEPSTRFELGRPSDEVFPELRGVANVARPQ